MTNVTKCRPGVVPGAGDLHTWASRRLAGRSGVGDKKAHSERLSMKDQRQLRQRDERESKTLAERNAGVRAQRRAESAAKRARSSKPGPSDAVKEWAEWRPVPKPAQRRISK
jgi:hypothetical protein